MLFSIKQSILAEETLANVWSFAKSANVSTLQSFPLILVNDSITSQYCRLQCDQVFSSCCHDHTKESFIIYLPCTYHTYVHAL